MTKKELLHSLTAYGFSRREAVVYLSLTELLEGSVTEIAKKADLPRSTVQAILVKLKEKQFIETFRKNSVLHFTPASFNKLITDLKEKEEVIQKALPVLANISNSAKQGDSMQIAEGKAGIKAALEDLLDMYRGGLRNVYAVSNTEDLLELLPKFFPEWAQKEAVHPVNVQMLVPAGATIHEATYKNPRMDIKRIPEQYSFPGDMTIAGSKVLFFHLDKKEPKVYIVESKAVADMQTKIFALLWQLSSK